MKKIIAMTFTLMFAALNPAHAAGDATKGATLYKGKCSVCHAPDQNRVGPKSAGVVGRKAGSLPDFAGYSSALKASGIVWDEATLDKWLSGPSQLVPGTKMAFKDGDAQERADIIAYLKTLK